jgi:hypothetical protein
VHKKKQEKVSSNLEEICRGGGVGIGTVAKVVVCAGNGLVGGGSS